METVALPDSIRAYFDTANRKDFEQTAALFSPEGRLIPPFDQPVVGREAIAAYLEKEARDMTFTPLESKPESADKTDSNDAPTETSFIVKGKVKNSLFVVNVGWQFVLTGTGEIESVRVKLLASLKELMKIRP